MSVDLLERLIISLLFGVAGIAKLAALDLETEAFARWGFPAGFMYFIGVLEVAGALGLWMSRLSAFVVLCLSALAVGALGTRLVFAEWGMAAVTAVLLAVCLHYAWRRRGELFAVDRPYEAPGEDSDRRPLP